MDMVLKLIFGLLSFYSTTCFVEPTLFSSSQKTKPQLNSSSAKSARKDSDYKCQKKGISNLSNKKKLSKISLKKCSFSNQTVVFLSPKSNNTNYSLNSSPINYKFSWLSSHKAPDNLSF